MVTLLAENGAKLDARDGNGKTALDIATQPGRGKNEAMAALLTRLAADPKLASQD